MDGIGEFTLFHAEGKPHWMWLSVQCVATVMRWYSRGEIRLGTGAMVVGLMDTT